jgi:hypothetical protein
MKQFVCVVVTLACGLILPGFVTALEPKDIEDILKEWMTMRETAVELLKNVKDKTTAEAVVAKLRTLSEKYQAHKLTLKSLEEVEKSFSEPMRVETYKKKYQDRMNQIEKNLDQEYARLTKLSG